MACGPKSAHQSQAQVDIHTTNVIGQYRSPSGGSLTRYRHRGWDSDKASIILALPGEYPESDRKVVCEPITIPNHLYLPISDFACYCSMVVLVLVVLYRRQ